ncbi:DUF3168 domain-containing protein [Litoribrevibacter albus]|uniref:DUF3168 domain-containing protein n=1 Tax=Litoribrevibacter albus TaxID=1473156 RepID=A0AA37W7Q5_9GAMM|nr:DUF3168 domain-containing protein [Litoribrevibacter albus]GLQ31663.1 hypothetical protein GCM10007876_21420 [Litoribrevibacter albus]
MIETAIYTLLTESAGLTALVNDRIQHHVLGNDATYPALTYFVPADTPDQPITGASYTNRALIQVDVWSEDSLEAGLVAAEVISALRNYKGTKSGVRVLLIRFEEQSSDYEQTTQHYRRTIELTAYYEG